MYKPSHFSSLLKTKIYYTSLDSLPKKTFVQLAVCQYLKHIKYDYLFKNSNFFY